MFEARPRVAKVDKKPLYPVLGLDYPVKLLHIVVDEQDVVDLVVGLAGFLKQLNDGASADAEHVDLDIERYYIDLGVQQRELPRETALAAAYFKYKRLFFFKSPAPIPRVFLGVLYKEVADAELGLCPFLFSYSHSLDISVRF